MQIVRSLALLFLLMTSFPVMAADGSHPKLVVAISVDQFSADVFTEYRQHFRGGFKRLLSQGVVFPSGYQGHAATETCPGHSTILTGARPMRTGIIANSWYDLSTKRSDKLIYCAEDENRPGTDSTNYIASPVHLRVATLGDRMKKADRRTRIVAVAGKDRSALMMAGGQADQIWWWGGQKFVTLGGRASNAVAEKANAAATARLATPQPPIDLPQPCGERNYAVQAGSRTVGTGRFARAAGDAKSFRASPELDSSTLALAAGFRDALKLGEGTQTDLLIIGASATDYVGHAYGTQGTEMCGQLMTLDRNLGEFFDSLDSAGIDYLVVLTADHGGHDLPERSVTNGAPSAKRVDVALNAETIGKAIGTRLGLEDQLLYADGPNGDYYVSRLISETERRVVANEAATMLKAHPQVVAVFSRDELAAAPMPKGPPDSWPLLERARASFDAQRSGDLVVMLKPWVTPIAIPKTSVATHGSPWDYDRRVPILFWRKGIRPFEQPLAVETADIMPTLATQIGLAVPSEEIDGRCLDLIAGEGDSCR
ncbi:putative AlkP superfamily pyrophosphatase or phosphodiesterase [Rhizorhapis suberifaciens]|uniref:Alkaline phosphatase n=1 Tax=Rhizorhapis suberifaciens TaxID=13656 RepID=A0A840HRK0_9SPHN|nr:putative AlkP superfamily pyrophosphatase or phosphodiesterase [Rhizorhapis suberifaciens]